jgi:hypothetical protein
MVEQENVISEIEMVDSQSLAFGMKVEARMLSIYFQQSREVLHAYDEEIGR